jgi:hypothetical protein
MAASYAVGPDGTTGAARPLRQRKGPVARASNLKLNHKSWLFADYLSILVRYPQTPVSSKKGFALVETACCHPIKCDGERAICLSSDESQTPFAPRESANWRFTRPDRTPDRLCDEFEAGGKSEARASEVD